MNGRVDEVVYLDYNATTPVAPEVLSAMAPYWSEYFFNPSSPYPEATQVKSAVQTAQRALAELIGAEPASVVFTSGGTESNNWVLRSTWQMRRAHRPRIVISAIEHPAITETANDLARQGAEVATIPVTTEGVIDLEALNRLLDDRVALVCVMLANNEIGTIQPVAEVARLAHAVGAWVHTDAAQAVGKIAVDVAALAVDFLTVAGHKFYAPKGIGALYIRPSLTLPPLMTGGGQQQGRRSGTEPVALMVGLGMAARLAQAWLAGDGPTRQAQLRDQLERRLLDAVPGLAVFGNRVPRLPNTLAVAHSQKLGPEVLAACPQIRAGTGSACHHPGDAGALTLRAMGVPASWARGLVRLSLGRSTSQAQVDQAVSALERAFG